MAQIQISGQKIEASGADYTSIDEVLEDFEALEVVEMVNRYVSNQQARNKYQARRKAEEKAIMADPRMQALKAELEAKLRG